MPALLGGAAVAGCTTAQKKKATELALEAVGTTGDHPFLRNPGTDLKGVNSPTGGGGTKAVDARGAFGGTPGTVHCDKASLITQITQDPVEAKAWAQAAGIDQNRIAERIESLTEVILLDDTLVKNHDYQGDGRTREYLSVLQKGVAVLNDPYTGPVVKCNCGNPLGEPDDDVDLKASTYVGTRWETFSETTVTVIAPRARDKGPVKEVPLVDPFESDKAFDRGAGTDGDHDSATFHWTPPPRRTPPSPGEASGNGPGSPEGSAGTRTPSGPAGTRTPTGEQPPSRANEPTESPSGATSPATAPPTGASRPPATGAPPTGTRTSAPQPPASEREAVPTKAPPTKGERLPTAGGQPTKGERPPTAAEQPTKAAKSPHAATGEPSTDVKSPPAKEELPPTAARTPRAEARTPTAAEPVRPTSEVKSEAPTHHGTARATAPVEPPAEPRQPAGTHGTGSYGTRQGNR
ncbi:DUF6777 domain-containing protein [Streptomyces sp. NPDC020379]|uniref:DUF6777 domain-containing protein n=1 Tax=Streptomyces sp. NPDC020379 TaxID=3365071 RepID=UPI00378D2EF3